MITETTFQTARRDLGPMLTVTIKPTTRHGDHMITLDLSPKDGPSVYTLTRDERDALVALLKSAPML